MLSCNTSRPPQEALKRCAQQNADRIVIVPFFLQAGAHVMRDIPELVEEARKQYPAVEIVVTDYVGAHPLMARVVEEMINNRFSHGWTLMGTDTAWRIY